MPFGFRDVPCKSKSALNKKVIAPKGYILFAVPNICRQVDLATFCC